jgi:hypothetical protein
MEHLRRGKTPWLFSDDAVRQQSFRYEMLCWIAERNDSGSRSSAMRGPVAATTAGRGTAANSGTMRTAMS